MGNSSKFTFTADAHTFNFLLEGGYTYLVVATEGCALGPGRERMRGLPDLSFSALPDLSFSAKRRCVKLNHRRKGGCALAQVWAAGPIRVPGDGEERVHGKVCGEVADGAGGQPG